MSGSGLERHLAVAKLLADFATRLGAVLDQAPAPAPGLSLTPQDCRALDDLLGLGATRSAFDLLAAVARLGAIRIGEVRLPFTPGQLAEIQYRAQKRGRTVEAEMQAVVARIQDELFYQGG